LKKQLSSTLIIATYNWHQALELVLISVQNQSVLPSEIIIADDGSTQETNLLIDKFKPLFPIPLIHLWHEDNGFKKTIIMNKALKIAKSEYIIQIDGDIIIHKNFIENHLNFAKPNTFVHGSRTFLNKKATTIAFQTKKINYSIWNPNLKNKLNAFYFPFLTQLLAKTSTSLNKTRGCNFACWKKDIHQVNGYNEKMTGWGLEDTELAARFINNGILKRQIKFGALQYHLDHKVLSRNQFNINNEILTNTIKNKTTVAQKGIIII
jgi:glycosyltransferase involved in cell wall biosynthesis